MMEHEIIVPKLYEDLEKCVLAEWFIKENDYVRKGEYIFSIETEKAIFDIESEYEGTLKKILVGNRATIKPMDIIGILVSGRE